MLFFGVCRLFYEKCSCGLMQKVGPPEFDIPANVLDLVYSQCLYWSVCST